MGYIHFRANGTMEPMVIDAAGVSTYDARFHIEAERFFAASDGVSQSIDLRATGGGDGFAVGNLTSGSVLHYRNLANLPAATSLTMLLRVASAPPVVAPSSAQSLSGTTNYLTVHLGGRRAGECAVQRTASWAAYVEMTCQLTLTERLDQQLVELQMSIHHPDQLNVHHSVNRATSTELLRVDWFAFDAIKGRLP